MESDAFAVWLRERVQERGLSVRNVAMRVGISDPSLLALMKGRSKPKPETIQKLARFFAVDADVLMEMAGYRSPHRMHTLLPGWADEIRAIEAMAPADQDALLELLKAGRRLRDRRSETPATSSAIPAGQDEDTP